jgi:hypothetical protein
MRASASPNPAVSIANAALFVSDCLRMATATRRHRIATNLGVQISIRFLPFTIKSLPQCLANTDAKLVVPKPYSTRQRLRARANRLGALRTLHLARQAALTMAATGQWTGSAYVGAVSAAFWAMAKLGSCQYVLCRGHLLALNANEILCP